MTLLRRARFGLSLGVITLLGVMFIATMAVALDGMGSSVPVAEHVMSSNDDGGCPAGEDEDCVTACRVFCHGLVVSLPDPPGPIVLQPTHYREPITTNVGFAGEIEDPPPRA